MPILYGRAHARTHARTQREHILIIKAHVPTPIPTARLIHTAVYCSLFTLYASYYAISDKPVETADPHTASCHLEMLFADHKYLCIGGFAQLVTHLICSHRR